HTNTSQTLTIYISGCTNPWGDLKVRINSGSWSTIGSYSWSSGYNYKSVSIGSTIGTYEYKATIYSCDDLLIPFVSDTHSIAVYGQQFSSQGYTWDKEIRSQGASTGYYASEYSKITWSTGNPITAEETVSTYLRWVGFSTVVNPGSFNTIKLQLNAKVYAGHSSPQKMYAGIFTSSWTQLGSVVLISSSNVYSSVTVNFNGLTNANYHIFIFYNDAWSADWNTKIYAQNIGLSALNT
ncbi:MAG: hypothetical protein OEZ01_06725, partial [Candidatus Heimdallarchaeota archaeon]|nr:hypothetical protein [Candidatus Heimdallarchaeota archaeon]